MSMCIYVWSSAHSRRFQGQCFSFVCMEFHHKARGFKLHVSAPEGFVPDFTFHCIARLLVLLSQIWLEVSVFIKKCAIVMWEYKLLPQSLSRSINIYIERFWPGTCTHVQTRKCRYKLKDSMSFCAAAAC